jgi:hypothetical protein
VGRERLYPALAWICAEDGTPWGAGVLVGPEQVLTCAHVVASALGMSPPEDLAPAERVRICFTHVDDAELRRAAVRPGRWFPPGAESEADPGAGDLALLDLVDAPPAAARPVAAFVSGAGPGDAVHAFGLPLRHDERSGGWASGELAGRQASGWIQIDSPGEGYRIQPGFSGAAAWSDAYDATVGVIVAAERSLDARIAWMIPAAVVGERCPEVSVIPLSNRTGRHIDQHGTDTDPSDRQAPPPTEPDRFDDERSAPVLGNDARAFAAAGNFATRKERFILPLETSIRRGTRRLSRSELEDCSRSEWDFDRIAFYLSADYSTQPDLEELLFFIEQERERVLASSGDRSLIPLHYSVRAFRHRLTRDPEADGELKAKTKERFRDMLDDLLRNPELDRGGQVKKNLRRTIDLIEEREQWPRLVRLVLEVTVPESTDATGRSVCIAGTLDRLAADRPHWNPGGVVLSRVDSRTWAIELVGEPETEIEYKYTLGDWTSVEETAAGQELAENRRLTIRPDRRGAHTQRDTVERWRDVPPCAD